MMSPTTNIGGALSDPEFQDLMDSFITFSEQDTYIEGDNLSNSAKEGIPYGSLATDYATKSTTQIESTLEYPLNTNYTFTTSTEINNSSYLEVSPRVCVYDAPLVRKHRSIEGSITQSPESLLDTDKTTSNETSMNDSSQIYLPKRDSRVSWSLNTQCIDLNVINLQNPEGVDITSFFYNGKPQKFPNALKVAESVIRSVNMEMEIADELTKKWKADDAFFRKNRAKKMRRNPRTTPIWKPLSVFITCNYEGSKHLQNEFYASSMSKYSCFGSVNMRVGGAWTRRSSQEIAMERVSKRRASRKRKHILH